MKRRYIYHRHNLPITHFLFGLLLVMFFGWKLFFLFPLFLMLAMMTSWYSPRYAYVWETEDTEKSKHKPKNDDRDYPRYI